MTPKTLFLLILTSCMSLCALQAETYEIRVDGRRLKLEELFYENFSGGLENWLAEGDARINRREGWLEVDATEGKMGAATVWCRREFEGPQLVEYDVRLMDGSIQSNINMFLMAAENGRDLLAASGERNGNYSQYHLFPNYLITILNDGFGSDKRDLLRLRMRLNPGFELADERWFEPLVFGKVYHVAYLIQPPLVTVLLDGIPLVRTLYRDKLERGRHGLRIWHTHSIYDNFRVSRLLE